MSDSYFGLLLDHPVHLFSEVILILFVIYLWTTKSFKQPTHEDKLTTEEENELIEEWVPEPLVPPGIEMVPEEEMWLVEGAVEKFTVINGKRCLNLASCGVLGLQNHPEVKEFACETARQFGVGSCGPRGFYGSLQPHLDFEKDIAEFMGAPGGVLYPSEFQTTATLIPAFSKGTDYVLADRGCCFAVQSGLTLSKSKVIWFKHNDMEDLERSLNSLKEVFAKKVHRVFLIVEGIYANSGDICPLDKIMKLKERFCFRIILDETFSFGILGNSGKGVTEHFGIPTTDIEIIIASTGNALGSVGGFTVGDNEICSHQRLNCTGYVFSCASPPYTSAAASKSLQLLKSGEVKPALLRARAKKMHSQLREAFGGSASSSSSGGKGVGGLSFGKAAAAAAASGRGNPVFENVSNSESPFIHLRLQGEHAKDKQEADKKLKEMVKLCWKEGLMVNRAKYSTKEKFRPEPGLKLAVPINITDAEIDQAVDILSKAAKTVFG